MTRQQNRMIGLMAWTVMWPFAAVSIWVIGIVSLPRAVRVLRETADNIREGWEAD